MITDPKVLSRFWPKVSVGDSDECWNWEAFVDARGYGKFSLYGRPRLAHRVSFAIHKQDPKGWLVLHSCDNPACVNPNHLRLGTDKDNSDDKISRGRDRHALGKENGRAKLTAEAVREIRALYATGNHTHRELAKQWGVSHSTIGGAVKGTWWSHVKPDA